MAPSRMVPSEWRRMARLVDVRCVQALVAVTGQVIPAQLVALMNSMFPGMTAIHYGLNSYTRLSLFFGRPLPQHVIAELVGFRTVLGEAVELFLENAIGMRFFVLFEGLPVSDDDDVIIGFAGRIE
jgi:hypothetical protein